MLCQQSKKALSFLSSEYSKYFAKNSIYHKNDKFLFNPRLVDTTENIENKIDLDDKITKLSKMIRLSKYTTCLTGAGLSTSSGIPDYRSGANTILPTGPGKWELEENKKKYFAEKGKPKQISAINAHPTYSHMAISKLLKEGLVKFVVTQNVDNLHHMSGIPRKYICELHGNIITEKCCVCGTQYYRDYYTRKPHLKWGDPHDTGRICIKQECGGSLHDSLVFFGESVEKGIKDKANEEIEKSDLLLVIGTSLTVQSAGRLVWLSHKKNIPIVIINLQQTEYDKHANLKLGGFTDHIFNQLLQKLDLEANKFTLEREVNIHFIKSGYSDYQLDISCKSSDETNLSAIKSIDIQHTDEYGNMKYDIFKSEETQLFKDSFKVNQLQLNFFSNLKEQNKYVYPQTILKNGDLFSMSSPGSLIFLQSKLNYDFQVNEWMAEHTTESYK